MGMDLQKGVPVPKLALEPTTFFFDPWYEREDADGGRDNKLPCVIEVQYTLGTQPVTAGARVYLVSKGPGAVQVLASDPSPRIAGGATGPTAAAGEGWGIVICISCLVGCATFSASAC